MISNHPYTTEWMIQYGNKMGMQYGKVPAGTFDEAFGISNTDQIKIDSWTYIKNGFHAK